MQEITRRLSEWYKNNKRNLPWRQTSDPYRIWLSEVILQQTRIQQGLDYYLSFTKKYPTVFKLAEAHIDEVLKLWQGLGYYTRVRNLHATAKIVVQEYSGIFPPKFSELLKLKGVGEYTAAAIASIAFGEKVPVIDGNVSRVVSRLYFIEDPINSKPGLKAIKNVVEKLIDKDDPGMFNQAIMEFGSLQCIPKNPKCDSCILNSYCVALKNNKVDALPIKIKSKPQQVRHFYYLVLSDGKNIIIKKRNENDIWKGLFDFPLKETTKNLTREEIINNDWGNFSENGTIIIKKISKEYKHILSHRIIRARFIFAETDKISNQIRKLYILVPVNEISKYAVPRLIDRFLDDHKSFFVDNI